jgi:Uri superfamily endonuclease
MNRTRKLMAAGSAEGSENNNPGGAYILHLDLRKAVKLKISTLGKRILPPARYAYVGSARSGLLARTARHKRLARTKAGKIHWHIDHLLTHSDCRLTGVEIFPGVEECDVSRDLSRHKGIEVPVPGFGSSDCRSGCRAHLYRIP